MVPNTREYIITVYVTKLIYLLVLIRYPTLHILYMFYKESKFSKLNLPTNSSPHTAQIAHKTRNQNFRLVASQY